MTRTQLLDIIETKTAQLVSLNETYDRLVASHMDEYRFHSGSGTQWVLNRKLLDIQKTIDNLEAQIDWYTKKLNGKGLVNLTLRRQ